MTRLILYIKIHTNKFEITNLKTNDVHVCNASKNFSSPRLLIGDIKRAVSYLKKGLSEITKSYKIIKTQFNMLLQPMEFTRDISNIEIQILEEIA